MSKKNIKKNADIEAVEEVASENVETVETETPTVVTSEETAEEPTEDVPEASASVEISQSEGVPTEHVIRVKSDNGVYDVHVSAVTRQDAKYRVYLQLDEFGPNAKVTKFDIDKYLARKASGSDTSKKGKKKGEKKTRNVMVIDLDAPKAEAPAETESFSEEAEA